MQFVYHNFFTKPCILQAVRTMSLKLFSLLPCFLLLCEGTHVQGELESWLCTGQTCSVWVLCTRKKVQFMLVLCYAWCYICFLQLAAKLPPSCRNSPLQYRHHVSTQLLLLLQFAPAQWGGHLLQWLKLEAPVFKVLTQCHIKFQALYQTQQMKCLCMESSNLDAVHLIGLLISRYILKTMAGGMNSTYYFIALVRVLGTQIPTTCGSPCLVTDGSTCTFPMSMVAIFGVPSMPLGTANWSGKLCFLCNLCNYIICT